MLTLEYLDGKGLVSQREWDDFVGQNAALATFVATGEEQYAGSLGWLETDEWAGPGMLDAIEAAADEIRKKADTFVLIGVGGSNNAARAAIKALQKPGTPEIIYMGNTLSAHALQSALQKLKGKSVYVNCIAKNFETLEPGASFRLLRSFLTQQYGPAAKERIVATGTAGSLLEQLCTSHGWRFFTFPTNIGGRFTALSAVGLLPMAVAGINIRAMVAGAQEMRRALLDAPPEKNMALRYACLRNLLYRKGHKLEMLSAFEPQFKWFFKWWIQLFAESEGKDGKGIFPVASEYSEDLHSVGQYVQDGEAIVFETFLDVAKKNAVLAPAPDGVDDGFAYLDGQDFWQVNKAAFEATREAHSQKLPCLTLCVEAIDEAAFGQLFYFFQMACYYSGTILGVNPFDQPGVENYKASMFKKLGKQ